MEEKELVMRILALSFNVAIRAGDIIDFAMDYQNTIETQRVSSAYIFLCFKTIS